VYQLLDQETIEIDKKQMKTVADKNSDQ